MAKGKSSTRGEPPLAGEMFDPPESLAEKKSRKHREYREKEVVEKIPEELPQDMERGERLETAKAIAKGGKTAIRRSGRSKKSS